MKIAKIIQPFSLILLCTANFGCGKFEAEKGRPGSKVIIDTNKTKEMPSPLNGSPRVKDVKDASNKDKIEIDIKHANVKAAETILGTSLTRIENSDVVEIKTLIKLGDNLYNLSRRDLLNFDRVGKSKVLPVQLISSQDSEDAQQLEISEQKLVSEGVHVQFVSQYTLLDGNEVNNDKIARVFVHIQIVKEQKVIAVAYYDFQSIGKKPFAILNSSVGDSYRSYEDARTALAVTQKESLESPQKP